MGSYDQPTKVPTSQRVTAELIAALTTAGLAIKERDGYAPFVIVPEGFRTEKLTEEYLNPLPDHIQQLVEITDLESYIAYIKQFKKHTTAIFAVADDAGAKFLTVLDYHEAGQDGGPQRAKHRVDYAPTYSPEFAAWLTINGKPLTQEQFLDHLRKWGDTIASQSDADLIELASSLDFTMAGEYSSHVERVKGGKKLLFNERVEGSAQIKGKTVTVPEGITIMAPIFIGGREYTVDADLLYRPQGGALRIIVELRRQHLVIRQAVNDIVADVKEGTGVEPFLGRLKS